MRVASSAFLATLSVVSVSLAGGRLADAATVGYWRFEEGSGSTAADSSGNGNDGMLAGNAAFVSSVAYPLVDGATNTFSLTLDGVGDSVIVPDDNSLDLTTAFTVEAFVRRTGDANFAAIAVKRNAAGNSAGYGLIFGSTDGVRAAAHVASPGTIGTATHPLALNTWHHVAAVYDGAALLLYVDGVQRASVAGSGSVQVSAQPVDIGHFGADFPGQIDEVRISNVALTPSQFLRRRVFDDGFESGNTNAWSTSVP